MITSTARAHTGSHADALEGGLLLAVGHRDRRGGLTLIILNLPGLPPEALDRAARHAEWLSRQPDSRPLGTRLLLAHVRLWQGHADQTVTLCQAELSRPDLPDSSRTTALNLLHRAENQLAEE